MTTSTLTVAEFVTERLYEDEMMARAAGVGTWRAGTRCVWRESPIALVDIVTDGLDGDGGTESIEIADHIARHDPARVLARCAAMRKIVERIGYAATSPCAREPHEVHRCHEEAGDHNAAMADFDTLRALASIWSDHPDWREEWRA